jgi:4-hydroxybenzoate polyprenyltransferase
VFGLGTAPFCPSSPISSSLKAVFWLWSVLLQFNLNNQTGSPEEDARNKPWRPIPSGRISLRNAIILRWISVVHCCILSLYLRTVTLIPSIFFTGLVVLYNLFGWDRNGLIKNLMNGFGYSAMALGTVLVAG